MTSPIINIDRITLPITGMTCSGCAKRVEDALLAVDGVQSATINLALESASIEMLASQSTSHDLIKAVRDAGYDARIANDPTDIIQDNQTARVATRQHIELIIAILLTTPLVLQMVSMMAGPALGLPSWHLPVWAEWALATPIQFWIGRRFYLGAWSALKARAGHMDQLVTLGTNSAYFYSVYLVLSLGNAATGRLYFEAAAVIVTLILVGKYLEDRAKRSASEALRALMALQPDKARVRRKDADIELPISELRLGEVVIVKPGERLPVDGRIARGESELDESLITGESLPVHRCVNDEVIAGAINGNGLLEIKTTRLGDDTTLSRIAKLVSAAQAGKAPIQRLVDRISGIFVPIVLAIACFTLVSWIALGFELDAAMKAAISVLVIACPCALGLATPAALVAGTGAAARSGILIADIETLERAHKVDAIVFDKTGTLTLGQFKLEHIQSIDGNDTALLRLAASAQSGSEHPLAKGIVDAALAKKLDLFKIDRFQSTAGMGIEASIDGRHLKLGRLNFAASHGLPDHIRAQAQSFEAFGHTVVWLGENQKPLGFFALADGLRNDAAQAIRSLKERNIDVWLVTGDNRLTAERVAKALGIDNVQAEVRPEDKARTIQSLNDSGRITAMVGDGINDAPALAAAHVGMAMSSGTAVAAKAAGITLMRPKPSLVAAAMQIAAKTSKKIRQNLAWAFAFNLIGIPIAALGYLNPAIAGAAMALSSVSVVSNALWLKRWKPS